MPKLVTRHRNPVTLCVLDRNQQACLDVAHRFADVLPDERIPAILEGIQQSKRQHLLDVRRRVILSDASKLVTALGRVQ